MRAVLAALMFLVTPADAAEWEHYENVRFGYAIDVPPGFDAQGEADNGDGEVFLAPTAELVVYGSYIEGTFEDDVRLRQELAISEGFAITYQATTPRWASYSAVSGSKVLYERMITLCGGDAIGVFVLVYGKSDIVEFDPLVDRLVVAFKPTNGSAC